MTSQTLLGIAVGDVVEIDGYDTSFEVVAINRTSVVLDPLDLAGYPFSATYSVAGFEFQVNAGHIAKV